MTQSPEGGPMYCPTWQLCSSRHCFPTVSSVTLPLSSLTPQFLLWLQRQVINQKPTSNPTKFIVSFHCYPIFPPRTIDKLACSVLRITNELTHPLSASDSICSDNYQPFSLEPLFSPYQIIPGTYNGL